MPSLLRSFVKDNTIITIGNIFLNLKSIILIPIIIKTVGIETYGGYTLLASLYGIAYGISSFGVGYKAQRHLPAAKTSQERRELFYPQFLFHLSSIIVMSIVIILSSRLINELLFDNSIAYSIFLIPALLMTKALYSQANLYYRFTSRISIMTVMSLMYGYLDIAVILFCFYYLKSISINILLFSQSFVGLGIGVVSFYFIIRDINIRFIFYKLKELYLDIKIGFPLILNMIIDFILSGSDRYFIALYISVASVGYYSTGYMLGTLIILLPKAMGGALPQLLSRAIDLDDNRSVDLLLNYSVKIFIIIAIPYIAATTVISLPILSILANNLSMPELF